MLVFTLKTGDSFKIAKDITVRLLRRHGDGYRIGIEAPKDIPIQRDKVIQRIEAAMAADVPLCKIEEELDYQEQIEGI